MQPAINPDVITNTALWLKLTKYGSMKYAKVTTSVKGLVLMIASLICCVAHSMHTVRCSKESIVPIIYIHICLSICDVQLLCAM